MASSPCNFNAFPHGSPPMSTGAPAKPHLLDQNGDDACEAGRVALRRLVILMARQAAREMFEAAASNEERGA